MTDLATLAKDSGMTGNEFKLQVYQSYAAIVSMEMDNMGVTTMVHTASSSGREIVITSEQKIK